MFINSKKAENAVLNSPDGRCLGEDSDSEDHSDSDTGDDEQSDPPRTTAPTSGSVSTTTPDSTASLPVLTAAQEIKLSQEQHRNELERHCLVLQAIKDSLFVDPFIERSAAVLKIPEDQKIVIEKSSLVFLLQKGFFEDWMQ